MLDQQDGAAIAADALEEVAQRELLGGVHAGRGFVECQQQRLGRERTRDLETSLVPIGQRAGRVGRVAGNAHIGEQLHRTLADRLFLVAFESGFEDCAPDPGAGAHMPADHHVLEGRHGAEQADVLEGASDAGAGHLMHRGGLVGSALEREVAGVGRVKAGDHVEEGGLAGAVGPDQAVDLTARDLEAHIGQSLQPAEALAHTAHRQQRHGVRVGHRAHDAFRSWRGAGHRPSGRRSMISTIARPKTSIRSASGATTSAPKIASCAGFAAKRSTSGMA